MGVANVLPKFQTLLFATNTGINLQPEGPSIAELGRLHWSKSEVRKLKKEKVKQMALEVIQISTLPVRDFGRHSTEPRITITEGGQFMFNAFIKSGWEIVGKTTGEGKATKTVIESGIERMLVRWDSEARLLVFTGLKKGQVPKNVKEADLLPLKISKDGSQILAAGTSILRDLKFDFDKVGNQNFEAKFDERLKSYVMTLPPSETLTKKPVTPRKPKVAVAAVGANGAVAPAAKVAPPAEEDLLDIQ